MIYAVFLCDVKWKINIIRQCSTEISLTEGEVLSDLVAEKEELQNHADGHYALKLTFSEQNRSIPAIFDSYKEGTLVILAEAKNDAELIELNNECPKYQEWAKNHFLGLYHNEYYLIQQMNNQLVDAQRKLTRSNRKLESALRENQEINEKLDQARIFAEHANASKTKFLANMSHDIRTPMNAIVGLTELMQHNINNPQVLTTYISKLQSSSRYLLDLINDILDLSKIENGSMELKLEPMDIGAQIEQVVTIIRPQINKKKQILSVQSDCTDFVHVQSDPVRFRQILMNLFSNAVKYTPEGGNIRFTIREVERTDSERTYQFLIEDDGIGMEPEFLDHIFDPFARAESDVKGIQGTGLGMAITKSIIDAMGGKIRVNSILGKGSQFIIELCFEVCEADIVESQREQSEAFHPDLQISLKEDDLPSLEGMKFLCAEDNELNAEILKELLEMNGASCTIYPDGEQIVKAFKTVKAEEYDAILMDMQMPKMNGLEATKAIRNGENPLGKSIPIIAMTANAFLEDVKRCLHAGMDAHIAKPIDLAVLQKTWKTLMMRRGEPCC